MPDPLLRRKHVSRERLSPLQPLEQDKMSPSDFEAKCSLYWSGYEEKLTHSTFWLSRKQELP